MCDDYIIPAGKSKANQHLGCGSVNDSLNLLLKLACGRFRLRSGSLQTDLSLIVQSNPPAVVSAQAPRSFVIYNSQFPLASSRFGRNPIQYRVGKTHCQGHQDPSKSVSIFLRETEANLKMVSINRVSIPQSCCNTSHIDGKLSANGPDFACKLKCGGVM